MEQGQRVIYVPASPSSFSAGHASSVVTAHSLTAGMPSPTSPLR